jgi:tetratricopeptide (TPR) repeat protein
MSICPWCKGSTPRAYDVCPLCGKSPHEHPSISAGGFSSFDSFDDDDEPGGLNLAGSVEPLSAQGGPDAFGGDAFEAAPAGLSLELDVSPRQPLPPQQRVAPTPGPHISQPSLQAVGAPRQEPPPSDGQEPVFDVYDLAVLADFGAAPDKLWEFPTYALRVASRKRDMQRRIDLARQSAALAERARDDCLADLAEQVRPAIESSREMAPLLEPLLQVEQQAASREQALSERNLELEQKVSVVDQQIDAQRGQEASARAQADAAAKSLDQAKASLERARAAFKRAEIELRNVQEVARAAAGPQARTALPEHAQKIQDLSQILAERREALAAPQAAFDEAQRVWNAADSASKAVQRGISDLQKQRRAIEQSYAKELGVRSQGVEHAQSERRAALVALGASLIETSSGVVPQQLQQRFFQAQEALEGHGREVARLRQAMATADPGAVKKGWIVLGAGSALVVLLLIVLIALFGRSDPEPLYGSVTRPATTNVFANAAERRSCACFLRAFPA